MQPEMIVFVSSEMVSSCLMLVVVRTGDFLGRSGCDGYTVGPEVAVVDGFLGKNRTTLKG